MGGGHKPYEIPDYRMYKIDGIPELEKVRAQLAEKGLKDPWLRNEVWRFTPDWGTPKSRLKTALKPGIKYGFYAFVLTVAIETVMNFSKRGSGSDHH